LQAEVAAYIDAHLGEVDETGHRLVVRNGSHQPREVVTAAGAVGVRAPRVNDKRIDPETGERRRFASAILPAWARKSPQMTEVLPLLYLHGLSSGDFGPALEQFLGSGAGLSAASITRLTAQWQDEAKAFGQRDLSGIDFVYLWVDGIHLKVRLDQEKLCLLVMIGVRTDGRKELIAISDGYRESTESWADLLRDCRRRGMTAPVLAVGDGALGFWKAVREMFPNTREQRCWWHKQANVLAALPKSAHPGALAAMREIYNAEDIDKAQLAIKAFEIDYGAKYPKAVAKIVDDADVLLEFYKYPAQHWVHLRTTNPIESTFATVRLRTKVTKGPGSRAAGIAMAYKLIDAAQARWRAVNAPHLVALVRAGAVFHKALSSVPGTPRRRENGLGLPADAEFSMGPVSPPQSLGAGARPRRVTHCCFEHAGQNFGSLDRGPRATRCQGVSTRLEGNRIEAQASASTGAGGDSRRRT
jgi:transposase-like protein